MCGTVPSGAGRAALEWRFRPTLTWACSYPSLACSVGPVHFALAICPATLMCKAAGGASAATVEGHYAALGQHWQRELDTLLAPVKAHVNLYNAGLGDTVRKACEFSV